ncbi:MAG: tetratricopeptide repeat protein, partial [Verrucomicrobiia bacterium]
DYFDWPITLSLKDGLASGVVVIGLLGATVWAFRRQPWLGFLGAWFFLILGPTSSFLPSVGEAAAERRMYLPLAAVVTLVVLGAFAFGKRLWNKQQGVVLGCVAGGFVAVLLTFLTIQRNRDYNSALTIWQDAVVKRPDNPRAHNNLGTAFLEDGKVTEAIGHYERALRIRPGYAEAHNNLGTALLQAGKVPEAIGQYEQALRIKPDYAEAHNNLGNVLFQAGSVAEAINHWEQALRLKPDYAMAHYNLGNALLQAGRVQEAIGHYEQALRIDPDFVQAQSSLARARAAP